MSSQSALEHQQALAYNNYMAQHQRRGGYPMSPQIDLPQQHEAQIGGVQPHRRSMQIVRCHLVLKPGFWFQEDQRNRWSQAQGREEVIARRHPILKLIRLTELPHENTFPTISSLVDEAKTSKLVQNHSCLCRASRQLRSKLWEPRHPSRWYPSASSVHFT